MTHRWLSGGVKTNEAVLRRIISTYMRACYATNTRQYIYTTEDLEVALGNHDIEELVKYAEAQDAVVPDHWVEFLAERLREMGVEVE